MHNNQFTRKSVHNRLKARVAVSISGCWIWTGPLTRGYGRFYLYGKKFQAHRASWTIHFGAIPSCESSCALASCDECLKVLHRCDVRSCVNPQHLFLGTSDDNTADRDAKGRHIALSGEENGNSKLTSAQVNEIRSRYKRGNGIVLAREYGISATNISDVVRGNTWRSA